ncbi:MAG: dihydrodipicolinate synthase family protein [Anaerolineae bacterium]
MRFEGMFPPIPTPFDAQGNVDHAALAGNVRLWNETGLRGYVVAGSNGESALLERREITACVETVRGAALSDMQVIAGTGCQSTAATIALTKEAAAAGANAALVITPFFFGSQMTGPALHQHYTAVADASPIPLLIYNVPKFTNVNIAPEVAAKLGQHPNIAGVKDSAGIIGQIIDLIRLGPADWSVLVGNGATTLSGLQAGASGAVLALSNVAPRETVALWQHVCAGRQAEATALQFRLMAVNKAVTAQYGVPGLKAALDMLGYRGGDPRPPLLAADAGVRAALRLVLGEAGLLAAS